MNAAPTLTITRLRSHAPVREPVIARLAVEALVDEVAQALPALPPQTILLLRRLALAVPGLNLAHLPDATQRADTARTSHGLLSDAWAHAARPAHGPVSDQVPAVLFGDPTELLACIARDGLAGRLDRWWWRALLGSNFPDWRIAWHDRVEAAPAALRLLARAGLEASVLRALGTPGKSLVANEAAPPVEPHAERPTRLSMYEHARTADSSSSTPTSLQVGATSLSPPASMASEPAVALKTSPARSFLRPRMIEPPPASHDQARAAGAPRSDTHSPADQEAFGPDPEREPRPERKPESAPARSALAALYAPPHLREGLAELSVVGTASSDVMQASAVTTDVTQASSGQLPAAPQQATTPKAGGTQNRAAAPVALAPRQGAPTRLPAEIARVGTAHAPKPGALPVSMRPRATGLILTEATPAAQDAPAATWPLDATPLAIRSRHARLFFLINLMLGDGLYPDFTQPADPGFPVPIWRLLALLGVRLAGPALRDDALWALLERLADELPVGADCNFDLDWPLPGVSEHCHPLALRHAPRHGLARWLARYHRSVRARLAPALGQSPGLVGRAIVQREGDALLWVSEAEIVVVQALEDHPVEWRLAGLDRDPGYLPSAGRTLRFVFE
jgi:hypothetical protein